MMHLTVVATQEDGLLCSLGSAGLLSALSIEACRNR